MFTKYIVKDGLMISCNFLKPSVPSLTMYFVNNYQAWELARRLQWRCWHQGKSNNQMQLTWIIQYMAMYTVKLEVNVMLWSDHMLCPGLTNYQVKWQRWLKIKGHGFLKKTVGGELIFIILCNQGVWNFLRWGLVICNNRTIPLTLLLRN